MERYQKTYFNDFLTDFVIIFSFETSKLRLFSFTASFLCTQYNEKNHEKSPDLY